MLKRAVLLFSMSRMLQSSSLNLARVAKSSCPKPFSAGAVRGPSKERRRGRALLEHRARESHGTFRKTESVKIVWFVELSFPCITCRYQTNPSVMLVPASQNFFKSKAKSLAEWDRHILKNRHQLRSCVGIMTNNGINIIIFIVFIIEFVKEV